jgi:hypothetical protein
VAQFELLVSITLTWSLPLSEELVNTLLLTPALIPFTCHWYNGLDPAFVGLAVKIAVLPEHIVFEPVIVIVGAEG